MITVIFEMDGVTLLQYDEICRIAGVGPGRAPDGLLFHSCSDTGTGFLVTDVWENQSQFEAFAQRLMPAIAQAGVSMPEGQGPRVLRTHSVMSSQSPVAV